MPDYEEITLCNALAIRDVTEHTPTTDTALVAADVSTYKIVTVKIRNTHDQAVRVQLRGNVGQASVALATAAADGSDTLGSPIDVLATTGTEIRIMSVWTDSKPPIIYATATALVLPTTGTLSIVAVCQGSVYE